MNFGEALICCAFLFNLFNSSPFISFERTFAGPIYQIKKIFNPQTIKPKDSYIIVLVGDSMTDALGSGLELKKHLGQYYPGKKFEIKNFSVGSTNILTLPDRLQNLTNYNGRITEPALNTDFDIIIIESFGHNPLSQYSLQDGLKKHNETLDKARSMIKQRRPAALVVLLATIGPHSERYAEGVVNLSPEERKKWAKERVAYIKNHIDYAHAHKIPLINIYEKSLDTKGEANIDYISTDFIHPSVTGVDLISKEIADFIFNKRIIPL